MSAAGQLAAAAGEVEAGRGPVAVSVLVTSWSCWYLRSSGSGWRSWSQPGQRRGGGVMRPGVLTQVRSRGRGRKALGLDEAGFRRRFAHLFRDACAA
jgi:hypothetical protein